MMSTPSPTPSPTVTPTATPMKKAIVVLTRGYTDIAKYKMLIQRNINISKNLTDKNIHCIVFHEGNVLKEHQSYIISFTPNLKLNFVNVKESGLAFCSYKECAGPFPIGYRHMCSFWFVDFWHFCMDYDTILRIDEDCKIDFNVDEVFEILHETSCLYSAWWPDTKNAVIKGLSTFTEVFAKNNGIHCLPHKISGPYTNVVGLNLMRLRECSILQDYTAKVSESNMIYKHRWGDLALWGEYFIHLSKDQSCAKIPNIKYHHGSHNIYIT